MQSGPRQAPTAQGCHGQFEAWVVSGWCASFCLRRHSHRPIGGTAPDRPTFEPTTPLSRGAAHVTFFENGRAGQKLIRENIALCRVEDRATLIPRDARRPGQCTAAPATLVFLDPPYGRKLGEAALEATLEGGWIAPGAVIVWEESAPVTQPGDLTLCDERRYGDTVIRVFRRG